MTPTHIAETASRIASELNLEIEVLDKAKMQELGITQLTISGQYREQYPGFHNRGYFGYIYFPVN